jgi:hypothetical protein
MKIRDLEKLEDSSRLARAYRALENAEFELRDATKAREACAEEFAAAAIEQVAAERAGK